MDLGGCGLLWEGSWGREVREGGWGRRKSPGLWPEYLCRSQIHMWNSTPKVVLGGVGHLGGDSVMRMEPSYWD